MPTKTVLSLILISAMLGVAVPARADDAELRRHFREAIKSFEANEIENSVRALHKLFAGNPSNELAYEFAEEGGWRLFMAMVSEGGEISTFAKRLLRMAEERRKKDRPSLSRINELKRELRKDEWVASRIAMEKLVTEVGPYVVPEVSADLADKMDDEWRAKIIMLMIQLGENAVLPLAELLKSQDSFQAQQAAIALGLIKDMRAVPYLLKAYESGTDHHVKNEAGKSLTKITGMQPGGLGSAKEWLLYDAHLYYNEHPKVYWNYYKDWLIWSWNADGAGKLEYREVPSFAWNEQQAEELCYLALETDAEFTPAWDLLVNAYMAQAVEAEAIYDVIEQKVNRGEREGMVDGVTISLTQLLDELDRGKRNVARVRMLCRSRGNAVLFRALYRAMADKKTDVAAAIIQTLEELEIPEEELPGPQVSLSAFFEGARPETVPVPTMGEPRRESTTKPEPSRQPSSTNPPAETKPDEGTDEEGETDESGRPRRPRRSSSIDRIGDLLASLDPNAAILHGPTTTGEMPQGYPIGSPLPAALTYEDKLVRFQAAISLAKLNLRKPYANAAAVIEVLAEAIDQLGQRVVLVVENDTGIRNRIVGLIHELGHLAFSVDKGTYALHRAKMFPAEDLIIYSTDMNLDGSGEDLTAEEFVAQLKKDYRTERIPVFLLTSRSSRGDFEANMKDTGKVADVISHDIGNVALRDKLNLLFESQQFENDSKKKATRMAARAAEALASIDPRDGIYSIDNDKLKTSLRGCLELQPDEVRVPALHAIGRLKIHDSFDNALAIFDNGDNSDEVRIAAAYALGELLREKELSDRAFSTLKLGMADENQAIADAAAEALGKSDIDATRILTIFREQRVE